VSSGQLAKSGWQRAVGMGQLAVGYGSNKEYLHLAIRYYNKLYLCRTFSS